MGVSGRLAAGPECLLLSGACHCSEAACRTRLTLAVSSCEALEFEPSEAESQKALNASPEDAIAPLMHPETSPQKPSLVRPSGPPNIPLAFWHFPLESTVVVWGVAHPAPIFEDSHRHLKTILSASYLRGWDRPRAAFLGPRPEQSGLYPRCTPTESLWFTSVLTRTLPVKPTLHQACISYD